MSRRVARTVTALIPVVAASLLVGCGAGESDPSSAKRTTKKTEKTVVDAGRCAISAFPDKDYSKHSTFNNATTGSVWYPSPSESATLQVMPLDVSYNNDGSVAINTYAQPDSLPATMLVGGFTVRVSNDCVDESGRRFTLYFGNTNSNISLTNVMSTTPSS